jgi:hypothetical protein
MFGRIILVQQKDMGTYMGFRKTLQFKGNLKEFEEFLQYFLHRHGSVCTGKNKWRTTFQSKRLKVFRLTGFDEHARWGVTIVNNSTDNSPGRSPSDPVRRAMIVIGCFAEECKVDFYDGDGYSYNGLGHITEEPRPEVCVGEPFEQFVEALIRELEELSEQYTPSNSETEPADSGSEEPVAQPAWFPKTERTLSKWRKSYKEIQKLRDEYQEDWHIDDQNPRIEDMRERLSQMPEWNKKPSASTVRRIRNSGDDGCLD